MSEKLIHRLASVVSSYLNCAQTSVGCELQNERARKALAEYEKWEQPVTLGSLLTELHTDRVLVDDLASSIPGLEKDKPHINAYDDSPQLVLVYRAPRDWTSEAVLSAESRLYGALRSSGRVCIRIRRQPEEGDSDE